MHANHGGFSMKLSAAIFSAVLAVSFSSLAAAQSTATDTNRAATGASDVDKKPAKKSAKKSAKAKAKANAKAAGGSSSANTSADGRDNAPVSSPSQNSGTPGSANQGSVHNDQTKK
jgi:hypothetical protein